MTRDDSVHADGQMPITHWSEVADAGGFGKGDPAIALSNLLKRYMPALHIHLVRNKRMKPDQADDLLQSFIAEKILEQELINKADPARGRFRTLLLTALDHHIISRHRYDNAKKRKPHSPVTLEPKSDPAATYDSPDKHVATPSSQPRGPVSIPIDEHLDAADPANSPSKFFDIEWARLVIDESICQMRGACEADDRNDLWGVFEARVLKPILDNEEPTSYEALVKEYQFESPVHASNALVTAKRRFEKVLRQVVGQYAATNIDVEQEILDLRVILTHAAQDKHSDGESTAGVSHP